MHFDLAHALVTVVLLLVTNYALTASGLLKDEKDGRWSWKRFVAFAVVVFVLNLIWPA